MQDWMAAQAGEDRWETYLHHCPVCADCGRVISQGRLFPLEENGSVGCLCPRCMLDRMIPLEEFG